MGFLYFIEHTSHPPTHIWLPPNAMPHNKVWSTLFQFKDKWGTHDQCYEAKGPTAPSIFGNNPDHNANGTLGVSCASRGFARGAGTLTDSPYDAMYDKGAAGRKLKNNNEFTGHGHGQIKV